MGLRSSIRTKAAVLVAVVALLGAFAAGSAWSANPFTDIAGSNHANNIDAIYNAGITLGCATEPDRYCPDNPVTRGQMASFLARGLGLSSGSTKNLPKANGRSDVQVFCAVAAANPGSFDRGPCRPATAPVDSNGDVGEHTSVAIGATGHPIISYSDETNGDLKVAACITSDCSGVATVSTLDAADNVGQFTSIAIGANGRPVISYYDTTNTALKVAACTTTDCTGTPVITTIDNADNVGLYSSIAIGANDLPVISYTASTAGELRVAACNSPTCTSTTITAVDTSVAGQHTSITIRPNGLPIISYHAPSISDQDLKVAACTTANCSGTATITTVDEEGDVGKYSSIAIGMNGRPIISYFQDTNIFGFLKVAACTTTDCTDAATITTLDTEGDVGRFTSIAIGFSGLPVISYHNVDTDALRYAACTVADCSFENVTITTVDGPDVAGPAAVGSYSSLTIGIDGQPVISYHDITNGDLKVARVAVT